MAYLLVAGEVFVLFRAGSAGGTGTVTPSGRPPVQHRSNLAPKLNVRRKFPLSYFLNGF